VDTPLEKLMLTLFVWAAEAPLSRNGTAAIPAKIAPARAILSPVEPASSDLMKASRFFLATKIIETEPDIKIPMAANHIKGIFFK